MFGYGFGPFGILAGIFSFIWWILIIVLIVWAIRSLVGRRHLHGCNFAGEEKTPLDILKERYAKGEINKQEFEEKKKDLE